MRSIFRIFTALLGSALMLSSCGNNTAKIDPSIAAWLDEIYAVVFENPMSEDLFSTYCTDSYSKAYFESDSIAAENGEVVLGYNLWTNSQDWDNPSMSVSSAEVISANIAEAIVLIKDMGYEDPIKFLLSKEGDSWKIADFLYNYDDAWVSTLEIMESYISDSKNAE